MKLTVTNNYPALKAQVEHTADEDTDPRDNDVALCVTANERRELGQLLRNGQLGNEEGIRSCHADLYRLYDGMVRIRVSDTQFEIVVKDETRSAENAPYYKDVTSTERGPWWKMLRRSILDALEQDRNDQMQDLDNLESAFEQHFAPKPKGKRKK
jgi:hypothetical protein